MLNFAGCENIFDNKMLLVGLPEETDEFGVASHAHCGSRVFVGWPRHSRHFGHMSLGLQQKPVSFSLQVASYNVQPLVMHLGLEVVRLRVVHNIASHKI